MAVAIALTVFLGSVAFLRSIILEQLHAYDLPTEKLNYSALRPPTATAVKDRFGKVLFYRYGKWLQIYRPIDEISPELATFVVFMEDAKFYMHNGFDVDEIKNSIEENLEKGKVKRGASTITQQLAKNLFLDKDRSWKRKLFEVPWTLRLEKDLSKKQLLELYLNVIEWGPGIRGAEAAARHFFDKSASELELGQAMYLALIIPNPVRFDLLAHPSYEKFLEKKKGWMARRLVDEKKIPAEDKARYLEASFGLVEPSLTGRRFALSHEASYLGNRAKLPKGHYRTLLERNLIAPKKSGFEVTTGLDAELLDVLAAATLIDAEVKTDRYLAVKEGGIVRAFRQLPKGKTIDTATLGEGICADPYVCEEVPTIDWKNLAP